MPEKPHREMILDEINAGYFEKENGDGERALEIWLSAWSKILTLYSAVSRAFEKIEAGFSESDLSFKEWLLEVRELFIELSDKPDSDHYERLEKFIGESHKFFPESRPFLIIPKR
ncbi:MAG TPA: hypothetical protein PKK26_15775 [Candidatus Wallbacteria bacterium]|nr:hypothetical protein [Candidatus Wallbacteria bacterium]